MKLITLSQGKIAKIDDEDFERVSKYKWCVSNSGTQLYAMTNLPRVNGKRTGKLYLHRFIMGNPPGMLIDHRNYDTLDCQKSNLRVCSKSQNGQNVRGARCHSKSGVRGVYKHNVNPSWVAEIRVNRIKINLGSFPTIDLAASAYAIANQKYFGEFGGGL